MKTRWVFVALGALPVAGCGGGASVIVVVESDLQVPDELAVVRATIGGTVNDFALEGENAVSLPFSFAIVPKDDDASRPIVVRLEALSDDFDVDLDVLVTTGFVDGAAVRLPIGLYRSCVGQTCEAAQRCDRTGCVDQAVDPTTLESVELGKEI